jgi:fructose-bisphosphate aldolase, class I
MFAIVHQMRTRIITSSSFTGDRILAAILFENTMDRNVDGQPTAAYLVMLKLTLPEEDNLYAECVAHPKVVRVVALSGGHTREEANARLRRNQGIVASFSRALVEGLSVGQSDVEYNSLLDASIESIFEASNT